MVLVDTSVWIDHIRRPNGNLVDLLQRESVAIHPFVLGELACGNLLRRASVLSDLASLPTPKIADHSEVLELLDRHKFWGRGLGWIDLHLLASARLSGHPLWTLDKRLATAAAELDLSDPLQLQ